MRRSEFLRSLLALWLATELPALEQSEEQEARVIERVQIDGVSVVSPEWVMLPGYDATNPLHRPLFERPWDAASDQLAKELGLEVIRMPLRLPQRPW